MPELFIRIKKKPDGAAALSCLRADGTTTWQRQEGQLGAFFPLHDLTHYAVETVLGFRRAFYGLVAEGWDLSSFGRPDSRDQIPGEARLVELIVGFFDLERMTGVLSSADEFNDKIRSYHTDNQLPPPTLALVEEQVAQIRSARSELFARWRALPAGETLELTFDRAAMTTV